MINVRKLVKTLLEYSYAELAGMADAGRDERSLGLLVDYIGVDQGQHGHARTFWEVASGSKAGKKYKCVIEFHVPVQGGLFGISRSKWNMKNFHKVLSKADIKVHCNCPDFYWSGMKYNTGPAGKYKGALSPGQNAGYKGEPNVLGRNLKPRVRDPEEKNVICKHLLALKRSIGSYTVTFMRDIKNFDNNIKVNDEIARKMDEGKRALGKDIELVEVSDQDAREFIDPIIHVPEPVPEEKEEIKDNADEVITSESEPVEEEPKEEKAAEIIDEESEPAIEPEVEEDIIKDESDVPEEKIEEKTEKGAEEIIEDKNNAVKTEGKPEEVEEEKVLEKDKKDSDVADPNTVLGR